MSKQLKPADRRSQILVAAIERARVAGYQNVTREMIAADAQCSTGLVSKYLGTMIDLRRSVMRAAIKDGVLEIVAQGLVAKDRHALKAPDTLKQAALASLA